MGHPALGPEASTVWWGGRDASTALSMTKGLVPGCPRLPLLGDPSLRLKNGFSQDDASTITKLHCLGSTMILGLADALPSTWSSILRQLCPRCRVERIFRSSIYWGFPKMHDRCPGCGLLFNREPGYFLGAMYISYGLGLGAVFGVGAILWATTHWRLDRVAIWACLLFLPFTPMLTFLSRVLWIYLDQKLDPER